MDGIGTGRDANGVLIDTALSCHGSPPAQTSALGESIVGSYTWKITRLQYASHVPEGETTDATTFGILTRNISPTPRQLYTVLLHAMLLILLVKTTAIVASQLVGERGKVDRVYAQSKFQWQKTWWS
jgi:hypothetical protein